MIRRIIITAVFLVGVLAGAAAQNSIDRLIDEYSSVGMSKFTSAIERDPLTRRVKKVVNVLSLYCADADKFVKAFRQESHTGDFAEEHSDDGFTMVLMVRKARQNRIYTMRCSGAYRTKHYNNIKITVIVNYKQQAK